MLSTRLDKVAIALSGVCLIHCLLAPVALTVAPILAVNAHFDHGMEHIVFHRLMLWLVLPTSIIALTIGCRKHRNVLIAGTGILGMALLVLVAFWGHDIFGESGERIAVSFAGVILAISHFFNYRACQTIECSDKNCRTQHHH